MAQAKGRADAARLLERANALFGEGNIGAARVVLERAAETGSAQATFRLAETYDPLVLSTWRTTEPGAMRRRRASSTQRPMTAASWRPRSDPTRCSRAQKPNKFKSREQGHTFFRSRLPLVAMLVPVQLALVSKSKPIVAMPLEAPVHRPTAASNVFPEMRFVMD
jgi:hypothetical protein